MASMILKMSGITLLYILLTVLVWFWTRDKELTKAKKLIIGIVFGISSVLSTHFGVSYDKMVINVRDIGPLAAGLFFAPSAGIIAGLIGGIERYIVGTYFGIGSYTRIACSVSTCLAGFVAMGMKIKMFKGKKPSPFYAFFMGAVMEVFHMYVVFITHRSDMRMAFLVVSTCSIPMIIFTGIGMSLSSVSLQVLTGEWTNPLEKTDEESESLSQKFPKWLFLITSIVILGNFLFSYLLQTQSAYQNCKSTLESNALTIKENYLSGEANLKADSTVIYVLIAYLVNQIVVNNIQLINQSLGKITNGNLNEVVTVRASSEFASLSDDINQTVVALKGYIEAAEKRIEQELILARTIQTSALPQVFKFTDRDEFELFASMKPAEILIKTNETLCEGNDAEMFVTVWI